MSYRLVSDAGPLEWTAAIACGVAFLALWPAMRRLPTSVLVLRAATALLLLGVFVKPSLQRLEERYVKPRLAVVLDRGPSMRASDDRASPRLSRAVRWLQKNRRRLEERAEVLLFAGSGGARRLAWDELSGLESAAEAFEPASVFSDVAGAGTPFSRLWLLSDGAFEHGEASGESLRRLRAPVDALGVGPKRVKRGVSVSGISSPDFVFLHTRFSVSVVLEANQLQGGSVRARIWRGGEAVGEKIFPVVLPYEVFTATFSAAARSLGSQSYRLEIEGIPRERNAKRVSVRREFGVEVIRQKYRIMYLAGRPSFEYSHLREQLKSDPNHELVSFVILRNPENVSPVPDHELSLIPFPATEIFVKNLFQFDLFILENFAYWRFNLPIAYLQNLKRFVAQGGALLVIGGSNAFTKGGYQGTPLEEILPVTLWASADDFVPGLFTPEVTAPDNPLLQLGADARSTAELWRSLPPLDGFSRFASVQPGASVLLAHPTEKTAAGQPLPIVAVREFGRGKVMLIGTDSTWRWKLGGGRNWKIASFYGRFWSRAVQYLTGSLELKKVKFSPLPDRMPAREPAVVSLHVFDEHFRPIPGADLNLRLSWKAPGGARRTPAYFEREPGVFQLELTDLAEGRHTLRATARYRGQYWGEDSAVFQWERSKGESPLNRKRLKSVADRTGGRYFDLDRVDLEGLLAELPPVQRDRSVLSRSAVWSWPAWLWVSIALLLCEWFLRRRRGYI